VAGANHEPVVYDPFDPVVRADPYPTYAALRHADPVHRPGSERRFFLSRLADGRAALRDPRLVVANGAAGRRSADVPPSMLTTDGAEHRRLRAAVAPLLAAPPTGGAGAVARACSALPAGPAQLDLLDVVARPLALATLVELFAVGDDELPAFDRACRDSVACLDPFAGPLTVQIARRAAAELAAFAASRLGGRGGGLVERLVADRRAGRHDLDDDEIVAAAVVVLAGAYGPLVHGLGNALRRHAGRRCWPLATDDPPAARRRAADAVRVDSPIPFCARVVSEPMEAAGTSFEPGDEIVVLLASTNHDERAFPDSWAARADRAVDPLTFGAGAHRCPGATLAVRTVWSGLERCAAAWRSVDVDPSPPVLSASVPRGVRTLTAEVRA